MSVGLLAKLRGRSATELSERAWQALRQRAERFGLGDIGEPAASALVRLAGPDDGQPVLRGPFFAAFDDRDATLAALRSIQPGHDDALRARADRILSGRFDLLGHQDVAYGQPPDWFAEPLAGVRLPDEHWSRIDYLDPSVAGDHKLVFEVARHQWMVTLGQAWWCTRDPRYAAGLERALVSWLDANPPKRGVHWCSSLEVAFRGIAWTWVLALAGDAIDPALQRRMLGHLAIGARHVERYLSTWFSPNTHLTGEALGLFVLGTAFPQCPDAARWRSSGMTILLEWLPRHVRRDGTYVEQSSWYHRYTTDFFLHFLILAGRSGLDVRDRVEGPLAGMLEYLAWISRPDGTMPIIGDDDGGRLLFLDATTAHDPRVPLATGATLLGRGDLAYVARRPTPELAWLLGPGGVARWEALTRQAPRETSRHFSDGGCLVIRDGWHDTASVLVLDAGPHGFLNAGHSHADALSLDFAPGGRALLVDPGTFTYTCVPEWRDRLREGAVHNAATVDGIGAATTAGPFRWLHVANSHVDAWFDCPLATLVVASHDGFDRLEPRVRYRRSVVFVKPDLWVVRDELAGDDSHELAIHWQCNPGLTAVREQAGMVLREGDDPRLTMVVAEPGSWSTSEGWVSPAYGVREPAPHLRFVRSGSGGLSVTTILSTQPDVVAAPLDPGPVPGAVRIAWGSRVGILATDLCPPSRYIESDAALAWVEPETGVVAAAAVSRLIVSGERLLDGHALQQGIHRAPGG